MRPNERDRARKYRRRRAALGALGGGAAWERFVVEVKRELAAARPDGWRGLVARLEDAADPAARREVVGAVLDALERAEGGGG